MTDTTHLDPGTGIHMPARPPRHRDEEYDEQAFDVLVRMQREHFWYRGRHKLLLSVMRRELARLGSGGRALRAVDLGGGCGGWLEYLHAREAAPFQQLSLADSSLRALDLASPQLRSFATLYQVDMLDLPWQEEWDVIFLLDVLEHIPEDLAALREIRKSLRPGGLLFVTTPALKAFWTFNDELAKHQRRYSKEDFTHLARAADLEVVRTDYFMFLLSPALYASRKLARTASITTPEQRRDYLARTHRIPARPVNNLLARILEIESSTINRVRFPWGTSLLGVFRRPPG